MHDVSITPTSDIVIDFDLHSRVEIFVVVEENEEIANSILRVLSDMSENFPEHYRMAFITCCRQVL